MDSMDNGQYGLYGQKTVGMDDGFFNVSVHRPCPSIRRYASPDA